MTEQREGNPLKISDTAIENTLQVLTGDFDADILSFRKRLNHCPFVDIIGDYEFDAWRMCVEGWEIELLEEEKQTALGVDFEQISSSGPQRRTAEENLDYFTGVQLLRAFVGSAFVEQAKIDGYPIPDTNDDKVIDAPLFDKDMVDHVYSSEPGAVIIVTEDLDSQMQVENPRLYDEIIKLKDSMVEHFTTTTIELYSKLPEELIGSYSGKIRDAWEDCLSKAALRAYGWFTPNTPKLTPVQVKEKLL